MPQFGVGFRHQKYTTAVSCSDFSANLVLDSNAKYHAVVSCPNISVPNLVLDTNTKNLGGNFQENLKFPKICAFYGTRENLKVPRNRFDLGKCFARSNRSDEKGCLNEQHPPI